MKIPEQIDRNKHIFGTYSVMALNNIQTVLEHIRQLAGIKLGYTTDNYGKTIADTYNMDNNKFIYHPVIRYITDQDSNTDPEKANLIIEKLKEHFPFLPIIAEFERKKYNNYVKRELRKSPNPPLKERSEITTDDICSPLGKIFEVLRVYRNVTTHAHITSSELDKDNIKRAESKTSETLNDYYTTALRNTSSRYGYSASDLAFIQDHRYKREKDNETGKTKMKLDTNFFLSIQSRDSNDTGHISAVGVALLICLFLEKQYINIFLAKLPFIFGGHKSDSAESRVIRRSFAINSIKLPKERIRSEKGEMSIVLDMLNELKRCPMELFDTLQHSHQERFRTVSSDHNEVTLLRHSDRFPQLMLQYVDYGKHFERIRFQVNMGKLRYLFNPEKHCIDGVTRVRVLEHQLNGFGRIQEMEAKRTADGGTFAGTGVPIRTFENVQRDDANPASYPYAVDTYTHYLISNNRIGMSLQEYMPEVEKYGAKWYVNNHFADLSMSVLELPAMIFHAHLLGWDKTEMRIISVYHCYKKLFKAMENGQLTAENIGNFGIATADMPKKVTDTVIKGIDRHMSFTKYVKGAIAEMIQETKDRITRLKNDQKAVGSSMNKMGKRGFVAIKPGVLAEWIAKDIVKFQKSAKTGEEYGTDRVTGLNFRVMQSSIATFSAGIGCQTADTLKAMFQNAGLLYGSPTAHPFLENALRNPASNTIDFYFNYLKARESYLKNLQQQINNGAKIYAGKKIEGQKYVKITFANHDSARWAKRNAETLTALGDDYGNLHAIELPRQMFDEEIKNALSKLPEMKGIDFEKANVTYLIAEYHKRVLHDDFQPFYSWERNYRYIDLLISNIDKKKKSIIAEYTDMQQRENLWDNRKEKEAAYAKWANGKKLENKDTARMSDAEYQAVIDKRLSSSRCHYQKSEKMIRRYKVQDALMFILAYDTLKKMTTFKGEDYKLKAIMPDADGGILSEIMPMDFTYEKNGKTYTIHSKGMKIKNYGDFFRLVSDKRVEPLLDLVTDAVIEKDDIDTELKNYDDARPCVVQLIIDFEKAIYEKFPELKNELNADGRNLLFSQLTGRMVKENYLTHEMRQTLNFIRNAFDHNTYPKVGTISITTIPEIANDMLEQFGNDAKLKN